MRKLTLTRIRDTGQAIIIHSQVVAETHQWHSRLQMIQEYLFFCHEHI